MWIYLSRFYFFFALKNREIKLNLKSYERESDTPKFAVLSYTADRSEMKHEVRSPIIIRVNFSGSTIAVFLMP